MSEEFSAFAFELADASRKIILDALGSFSPESFATKEDNSPVTELDMAVEERIRSMIRKRCPDHGFLGEETPRDLAGRELVWIVDPIDGTKAFISGMPVFSTLISLAKNGIPFLGLMDFPALDRRLFGRTGEPTFDGGKICRSRSKPEKPVMAVSNPEALTASERRKVKELRSLASFCVYGGSALVYANVASGLIDICVDAGLDAYDYCSLGPVISGAGGLVTDWEGEKLSISSGRRIVATGDPALHEKALEILSRPDGEGRDFPGENRSGICLDGPPW